MKSLVTLIIYALFSATSALGDSPVIEAAADTGAIIAGLEQKMAVVENMQASFVQVKQLAIFDQKIVLEGQLCIEKPSLFAWHVDSPVRFSMVIKGDTVRQWDEDTGKVQKVSLKKNPAFQLALVQMKQWFSGSYTALQKDYKISLISESPVVLKFVPLEDSLPSKMMAGVIIEFMQDQRYIKRISIEEISGDSTQMTFKDVVINGSIDKKMWEVKRRVR
jgi:outer membrane lipoprotein-sorting protein